VIVVQLLAIFALVFLVKESEGPWGIMAWIRNKLFSNKYVGVFFFKLLTCYFCSGCWAGLAIYLLTKSPYQWNWAIVWILAGGAFSLLLDGILTKLHKE